MSIEQQARERWGEPNARLSNAEEIKFGSQGSKSVNRETGAWFDFEEWSGGHLEEKKVELAPNAVCCDTRFAGICPRTFARACPMVPGGVKGAGAWMAWKGCRTV